MTVLQAIVIGIIVGAFYGLVALGMSLLFGVLKYMNIAHGSFMILGGYASYWLFKLAGIDPFLSIPIVMIVMAAFGYLVYRFLLARLDECGEEERLGNSMLITFGLILVLDNAMMLFWTSDVKTITSSYAGSSLELGGIRVPVTGLGIFGVTIVLVFLLHFFLRSTYTGKAIRATAERYEAASLLGINVSTVYAISCSIGVALAGVAGTGIATMYSVSAGSGLNWLLTAMVVMVMAGMGNIRATLYAGVILGLVEQLGVLIVGGEYRVVLGLLVFVVILVVRPRGLFAR